MVVGFSIPLFWTMGIFLGTFESAARKHQSRPEIFKSRLFTLIKSALTSSDWFNSSSLCTPAKNIQSKWLRQFTELSSAHSDNDAAINNQPYRHQSTLASMIWYSSQIPFQYRTSYFSASIKSSRLPPEIFSSVKTEIWEICSEVTSGNLSYLGQSLMMPLDGDLRLNSAIRSADFYRIQNSATK